MYEPDVFARDASAELHIPYSTIQKWIKLGRINAWKQMGRLWVNREQVENERRRQSEFIPVQR